MGKATTEERKNIERAAFKVLEARTGFLIMTYFTLKILQFLKFKINIKYKCGDEMSACTNMDIGVNMFRVETTNSKSN